MKIILRLVYSLLTLTLLLLVTAVMSTTARAQALYTQTFAYTGSVSTSASAFGWNAYIGSTATDVSVSKSLSGGQETIKIFGNNGSPQTDKGYMAFDNYSTAIDTYIGFVSGLSLTNASSLTWEMSVNSVSNSVQPMVKVGTTWYVYNSLYTLAAVSYTTASLDTNMAAATLCTLDLTTSAQWKAITITPGTGWTIDTNAVTLDLTSSTISGIGFFATVYNSKTINFDSVTVLSVPEPTTTVALVFAGLVLGWNRRRRFSI